jgi:hypothetical protein
MSAPAMMQPFCAPFSRRMRVRRRVSISAMPTMPAMVRQVAEQLTLTAPVAAAQRQVADHQTRRMNAGDSSSSALMPVLPM